VTLYCPLASRNAAAQEILVPAAQVDAGIGPMYTVRHC